MTERLNTSQYLLKLRRIFLKKGWDRKKKGYQRLRGLLEIQEEIKAVLIIKKNSIDNLEDKIYFLDSKRNKNPKHRKQGRYF